jgi:predicted ATPase
MLEWSAEAHAIGRDHALAVVEHMLFPVYSGAAMITHGEHKEGHARLSFGYRAWQATGGVHNIPLVKTIAAQACLGMDQVEEAASLVGDAIEVIDRTGHQMYEAEAHRVLGEVLLARNDPSAAQIAFFEALEVAKSQQAKSWELRAAMSMARLWRDQGKRQEAYELLAPLYGWFTEGFDTLDLKEAKALLDELNA